MGYGRTKNAGKYFAIKKVGPDQNPSMARPERCAHFSIPDFDMILNWF